MKGALAAITLTLILALAIGAKAGWDNLPVGGNIIDRRGEPKPPARVPLTASLTGQPSSGGGQLTISGPPPMPFVPLQISGMSLVRAEK